MGADTADTREHPLLPLLPCPLGPDVLSKVLGQTAHESENMIPYPIPREKFWLVQTPYFLQIIG